MKYIVIPILKVLFILFTICCVPLLFLIIAGSDFWNFRFKAIPDFYHAVRNSFKEWGGKDYFRHDTPF